MWSIPGAPWLRFTASGGLSAPVFPSPTTSSIRFSYIALFQKVREVRPGFSALGSPRLHRFCLPALPSWLRRSCCAPGFESSSLPPASVPSLAPFFSSSALRSTAVTGGFFATTASADFSSALTQRRSPQVRCRIVPLVPFDSTVCVWMTFGLRCSQPARRPHPASLSIRVPTVESLLRASFVSRSLDPLLALRLRLPPPVPMISFHIISSDPCRAH